MDRISPHLLWVGHSGDGSDSRRLLDLGIEALVQLAMEEAPLSPPRGLMYHRFPIVDGPGNLPAILALAVATVAALVRLRTPTLVCCGFGRSRSPAIAAMALASVRRESPEESLRALAACRRVDVSPGLWRDLGAALAIAPDVGLLDGDRRP